MSGLAEHFLTCMASLLDVAYFLGTEGQTGTMVQKPNSPMRISVN